MLSAVTALPDVFEVPACATLLFLPLARAFARTIQVGCLEAGAILGHWPDPATLVEGLAEFHPTFLLAVPWVFEKLYDAAWQQASASDAGAKIFAAAAGTAVEWSNAGGGTATGSSAGLRSGCGTPVRPPRLRQATCGGRLQYAISGGAPLGGASHFFRGCGITVLEGYGLTEAAHRRGLPAPRPVLRPIIRAEFPLSRS